MIGQNEQIIYAVYLCKQLIISIKKYNEQAEINQGESDPYLMSISYLGGKKRGIVFTLTKNGFVVGKKYEFSTKNRKYKLIFQSVKMDTVDPFFEQFENDVYESPYLRDLDYENRSYGRFISHDFNCLPEEPRNEDIIRFSEVRESLSYSQKLKQQEGRRKDPIEVILTLLHEWQGYVSKNIKERNRQYMKELLLKKSQSKKDKKLFSLISDPLTDEDYYFRAEEELENIKLQLANGVDDFTLMKIKNRLPKIKEILDKKEEIEAQIEDLIELEDSQEKDLEFREL